MLGSIVARLMANTGHKKMSVSKRIRVPGCGECRSSWLGEGACMLVLGQGNILAVVVKHVLDFGGTGLMWMTL